MRRAFIDAGSYDGRSTRLFRKNYPGGADFEIHCFEVDPRIENREPGIILHREAVWIADGVIDFYLADPESSTLIAEKRTGRVDRERPVRVRCLDFSRWLSETFDIGDLVIVKLNIEGAEYCVLDRLLKQGAIKRISELYIEWHYDRVGISRSDHDELVGRIEESGVPFHAIWGTDWITTSKPL